MLWHFNLFVFIYVKSANATCDVAGRIRRFLFLGGIPPFEILDTIHHGPWSKLIVCSSRIIRISLTLDSMTLLLLIVLFCTGICADGLTAHNPPRSSILSLSCPLPSYPYPYFVPLIIIIATLAISLISYKTR